MLSKWTRILVWLAGLLGIAGIALVLWAVHQFAPTSEELSRFGAFLSGTVVAVWSLAGLILIYVAFLGQQRQVLLQEDEIQLTRMELRATREELRGQKEQLSAQSETGRQQQFDSTFFSLLALLNNVVGSLSVVQPDTIGSHVLGARDSGKAIFRLLAGELRVRIHVIRSQSATRDQNEIFRLAWEELFDRHEEQLGHYFRTLYHVIRFVHTRAMPYDWRKQYVDIVRAQMSSDELFLLFFNCYVGYGEGRFRADPLRV